MMRPRSIKTITVKRGKRLYGVIGHQYITIVKLFSLIMFQFCVRLKLVPLQPGRIIRPCFYSVINQTEIILLLTKINVINLHCFQ